MEKTKAIVISLGGTPEPLIFSINHQKPDYICFFVSNETKKSINEIMPKLDYKPLHHYWIETPSESDISACCKVLYKELPLILEKWGIKPEEIVVDYTGGTKTMSVALTLATIENSFLYSYVGGMDRTKDGKGVVISGSEKMWYRKNPWDELAVLQKQKAVLLFNRSLFASAAILFKEIMLKVSPEKRYVYEALKDLSEGYDQWDRFNHTGAFHKLQRAKGVIGMAAESIAGFSSVSRDLEKNLVFLEKLLNDPKTKKLYYCYDLLANAKRRAELEQKYDDAMARLYRAVEALAQDGLENRHGIDTSNAEMNKLPLSIRENYIRRYKDEKTGKIKIPLFSSYELLKELNDELGQHFFEHYDRSLRAILDARNSSILAHGFNSINADIFQKLFTMLLKFSGLDENDLPRFPELKF